MNFLKYFMCSCFCYLTLQSSFSSQSPQEQSLTDAGILHQATTDEILQEATYEHMFETKIPEEKLSSAIQSLLWNEQLFIRVNGRNFAIPLDENITSFILGYNPNTKIFQKAYKDAYYARKEGAFYKHILSKHNDWINRILSGKQNTQTYESVFSTQEEKNTVKKKLVNILHILLCDNEIDEDYKTIEDLSEFLGVSEGKIEQAYLCLLETEEHKSLSQCMIALVTRFAYLIDKQLQEFQNEQSTQSHSENEQEESNPPFSSRKELSISLQGRSVLDISVPYFAVPHPKNQKSLIYRQKLDKNGTPYLFGWASHCSKAFGQDVDTPKNEKDEHLIEGREFDCFAYVFYADGSFEYIFWNGEDVPDNDASEYPETLLIGEYTPKNAKKHIKAKFRLFWVLETIFWNKMGYSKAYFKISMRNLSLPPKNLYL